MKLNLLLILSILLLAGCGSGSSDSEKELEPNIQLPLDPEPPVDPIQPFTPSNKALSNLTLVDASGRPLTNANVEITAQTELSNEEASADSFKSFLTTTLLTDENGNVVLNDLVPGIYRLVVTIGDVTVTSTIVINANNASDSTTIAAPIIVNGDDVQALQGENGENLAIFASISGVIYDGDGPVSGVQVELSGGEATNGSVAIDITNEKGEYLLIVNVSLEKLSAMTQATLRISKDGYLLQNLSFNPTQRLAFVGENFELTPAESNSNLVFYSENFEQQAEGAVCGFWTAQSVEDEFDGPGPIQEMALSEEVEEPALLNLWHTHSQGLNIINAALDANLVLLAPDDLSEGAIPNPFDQKACWYGQAEGGNVGQGNFLGDVLAENEENQDELDGGTSAQSNGGAIVSPVQDFTAETGPLALTFKTWWEIESVNPNENGFDLLIIEYSQDGGDTWNDLARLNPLSDPQTGSEGEGGENGEEEGFDRAPIPFSNRGFNRAPAWTTQEPIDISLLAGESNVKFRFVFKTNDELFNGFRGWLLDDVKIIRQEGTFPHFVPSEDESECVEAECELEP
ncbi:hypothetical protein QNI23_014865 [Bermanella sp. WJH001]|uniref:hypothetical protein n=1 Tax=Bermanella sp. WJH001 TaxID=3048005 RepID=UPI0024BD9CBE|nr:hypothetical protein [Bermanella sp. WJH001]MDJ1539282.1 hypothetical protein [Bermanella sp. WJH001]